MKTIIMMLAIFFLAGSTAIAQTKKSTVQKKHVTSTKKYTCSMHPEVVRNKPGKCPKCQMALVPVKKKTSVKAKV